MFLQGISIVFFVCNLFLQPKKNVQSSIISLLVFALQCNPCIPKITLFPSPHSNGCLQKLLSFHLLVAMHASKKYSLSIPPQQSMPPKITLFPSPLWQCMLPKITLFPSPRSNPCFQKVLSFRPPCAIHDDKNTYFESTSILSSYHLPKINTLQGTCQS